MKADILRPLGKAAKRYAPLILTCLASGGVVALSVSVAKAAPKAAVQVAADSRKAHDGDPYAATKKEAVKSAWKFYIPSAAIGVGTIACIWGAYILDTRRSANLTSAYALVSESYRRYQSKVKELYGIEAHRKVLDAIAKEPCEDITLYSQDMCGGSSLDFGDRDPRDKRLFYDSFSGRYFESTVDKVIQAEYHLNRNFLFKGVIPLNEFYEFLGMEKADFGDSVGWSSCNGDLYWIDFNHRKVTMEDGLECYVIDMVFEPTSDYLEDL